MESRMRSLNRDIQMMVEYASSPIAIATRAPRFSWEPPLTGRGDRQSAYQICVASTEDRLLAGAPDLWDTDRVESDRSVNVTYAGTKLRSNQECFWTVRIWDADGNEMGLSRVASFSTALLDESDWSAKWIGMADPDEPFPDPAAFQQERVAPEVEAVQPDPRAPLLRKVFAVSAKVRRARAFVCGLGLFELRLNGSKVGDEVLATPRTDFRKRVLYSTYDVTPLIVPGRSAVGLMLGNGWFNGQRKYWGWQMQWYGSPRAVVQIHIEFEDGSTQLVVSDSTWKGDWSPITSNCIYDGESYDARLEQDGWDDIEFDDSEWAQVRVLNGPGGRLEPATNEPERVTETIQPVSLAEPEPGIYVYDLGRNIAGWARIRLTSRREGERVKLRFAEAVHPDGTLNPSSNGRARQEDNYFTKGAGDEVYEPRFTYHGFQYVEVTGYPAIPELESLEGRFARTAVARAGRFECANDQINRIHRCTVQSQLCNVQMGVPTDDTQRPERLGWGADAWGTATEAMYNLWMPRVYDKWIGDLRDQQDELGMVGMIAPQAGSEEDLVWTSAFLLIPWWQYLHYGDRRILEKSYPALLRYVAFLESTGVNKVFTESPDRVIGRLLWRCSAGNRLPAEAERGFLQFSQWGDHLATAEGSASRANLPLSIATAFYYLDIRIMCRIAEVLGRVADVQRFDDLASNIKRAFNERFFDPKTGYYDTGVQSAQAWALRFGLVPDDERERVTSYFINSVSRLQRRLTTGYAGTKYAVEALSAAGRKDIVWALATATHYPSWGHMLRHGRTTSTEQWDGESGSLNHAPLAAAIDEWFYSGLVGIRPDESSPGYEKIVFEPYIPRDLAWAGAAVRTVRGLVSAHWRTEGSEATLDLTVPANCTATVHIPTNDPSRVFESGVPAHEAPHVSRIPPRTGAASFRTGSGTYRFIFERAEEPGQ